MLRNLVISLFLVEPEEEGQNYERVITTKPKAKEARRLADRVITLGKKGTLSARRRALQLLGNNKRAVRKVFDTLGPRYTSRPGGYTRILGFPENRLGDNASQVIFELVGPLGATQAPRPEVATSAAEPAKAEPAKPEAAKPEPARPAEQAAAKPAEQAEQKA